MGGGLGCSAMWRGGVVWRFAAQGTGRYFVWLFALALQDTKALLTGGAPPPFLPRVRYVVGCYSFEGYGDTWVHWVHWVQHRSDGLLWTNEVTGGCRGSLVTRAV